MKPHEILQKVIDNKGSCDWADPNTDCMVCPLSQQREPSRPVSCCWDNVVKNQEPLSKEEENRLYVDAAKQALIEINIEELLEKK